MKYIRACIVIAALAAIFVVPSIASAGPILTAPTGTVYSGTYIEAENVGVFKMTLHGGGSIECQTAFLTGDLTSNANGHISGDIETAEIRGRTNQPNPHEFNTCDSPLGTITVTPNHSSNPKHNEIPSLPWCLTANNNLDEFTVRGGLCTEAARALAFQLHTSVGTCSYSKASVTGTYTTHPSDAVLSMSEQTFTKSTGSIFCPSGGLIDMSLTLRTDDEKTEPIYINKACT